MASYLVKKQTNKHRDKTDRTKQKAYLYAVQKQGTAEKDYRRQVKAGVLWWLRNKAHQNKSTWNRTGERNQRRYK